MADLLETHKFTDADKEACAERELAMRRRVYPRWVSAGKMSRAEADREIALMDAIAEEYHGRVKAAEAMARCGAEREAHDRAMDQ